MADENTAASQADATAREAASATAGAAQGTADAMRAGAARAGDAMREGGRQALENGSQISLKMIDQAEANAREAFEAMRRAAQARDVSEVMRVQGDYLREQGQRSMTQAREIGELIMRFGRDAVGAMRGGQG